METTLNEIRKHSPCESGWKNLLVYLGKTQADDEPLDFITLLAAVGIEDAIWCLRTQDYRDYCLFLADVAESVLPIYEAKYSCTAPRDAIQTIRDYHAGIATDEELNAAANAAYAANAADAAYAAYAAYAAAYAVYVAAYAADAAADAAAYAAKKNLRIKILRYGMKLFNFQKSKQRK